MRISQFLNFNTATILGHEFDEARFVMQKVMWNINDFVPPLCLHSVVSKSTGGINHSLIDND